MDFKTAQREAFSGWFSRGDCKIKVKAIELADVKAVEEEFVTIRHEFAHNPITNRLERVEWKEEDEVQKSLALGAKLIVEWENVTIDGEKAECTEENKRKLLGESPDFREFYTESINAITEQVKATYGGTDPSKNSKEYAAQEIEKPSCLRCVLLRVKGSEKGKTSVGRYLHRETPCSTCVPLYLMPINTEAFTVFMLCRNALLRNTEDGKPYDVDVGSIASTTLAVGGDRNVLLSVINLMRHLIYEELL